MWGDDYEVYDYKRAAEKWEISERRIRQLLEEGRIEGAIKNGNSWNIPDYAIKPVDKRSVRPDNKGFIIDLPVNFFDKVDNMKKELDISVSISINDLLER